MLDESPIDDAGDIDDGGLSVEEALDRLPALSMVEMYLELRARGWTVETYRGWLGELLRSQLLSPDRPEPSPT